MLKLGRMHRQTEEMFVDPAAMLRRMREVSDFRFATVYSLVLTTPWALKNHFCSLEPEAPGELIG